MAQAHSSARLTYFSAAFSVAFAGLLLAASVQGATIVNPNPGLVTVIQQEDPTWIEHFPLQNFVSWETVLLTNGQLTYTGGTVRYRNANGDVIRSFSVSPARFAVIARDRTDAPPVEMLSVDGSGNVVIPPNSDIFVPFSREFIDMNLVPATSETEMCFDELETTPGACTNPIQVLDVALVEYVQPKAPTYRFPMVDPSQPDNSTGYITMGSNGHEIGTAHRLSLRQRYAYDVGVTVDGSYVKGLDPNANEDFYVFEEWVISTQDGVVTVSEQDHPDNIPPDNSPGVGDCNGATCGQPDTCAANEIPGGGNFVVVDHGYGEWTFIAHLVEGSNNTITCGSSISGGDVLGLVGNSGSSSAPHVHVQTIDQPNPDIPGNRSFPMYYNNVEFSSTEEATPRRQLDVAIPSGTIMNILFPPVIAPLRSLLVSAAEEEPNETPAEHGAIALGATVFGIAESAPDDEDVPEDVAVRGDAIEDIFRFDTSDDIDVLVSLESDSAENLDVYVATGDLRVQNPTLQGTNRLSPDERVCLEAEAGTHYVMVTNNDVTKSANASYELTVQPDPQKVTIESVGAVEFFDQGSSCSATVGFQATIEDGCCVDPDDLGFDIVPWSPTSVVALGPLSSEPPVVVDASTVTVTGTVTVLAASVCPFEFRLAAIAEDCAGNLIEASTVATERPFVMPANANVYAAGRTEVPNPAGNGGGAFPVEIELPSGEGRILTFDGVVGSIDYGGCCPGNGPDGITGTGSAAGNDWDGLSGMWIARGRFTSAVFLDDQEPSSPALDKLDLSIPGIDFFRLAPALGQIFFVGDGENVEGATQVFAVPDGATRLFLGVMDAGPPDPTVPGFYNDNAGTVSGTIQITRKVPEPSGAPGLALGVLALMALGRAGRARGARPQN